MRMFVDDVGRRDLLGVGDGRSGMRNMIPMSHVRYVEEAMPLDEFVEELTAAENGDDDEPDDPQDDPELRRSPRSPRRPSRPHLRTDSRPPPPEELTDDQKKDQRRRRARRR